VQIQALRRKRPARRTRQFWNPIPEQSGQT
jgi:hypothetical protein